MRTLTLAAAVALVGCSTYNGIDRPPANSGFCRTAESIGAVVTNACGASEAFSQPDLTFEEGGAHQVELWVIDTFANDPDTVVDAHTECKPPTSEWDGLDCGPVADCYASFGVVLPDVYPEAPPPEQPVETECGDIAAWPEGYEQNPD